MGDKRKCRTCSGSGTRPCPRCDNTGSFTTGETCYFCQGRGWILCNVCDGTGELED